MATAASPLAPHVLRVAAVWGTTVVSLRTLQRGESFTLGDMPEADLPVPDNLELPTNPVRAAAAGWELDARGCFGGLLTLRGRPEDPIAIARAGTPVPVMPGDFGLIQYGQFSIFFQYTVQPIAMTSFAGPELLTMLAVFCSASFHIGILLLVRVLMTPPPIAKPMELTSPDEMMRKFGLTRPLEETPPPPDPVMAGADKGGGAGIKDPGAQDKKPQGGGKKIKGDEGKFGMNAANDHTSLPGEIKPTQHYGGLSEVLDGDTGKEIQNTIKSINSVSAALSGLNSTTLVLGSGGGTGLKGAGSGGGGKGDGVAFGSGTADTGFGAGGGGPGGSGTGGNGRGGNGNGTGTGNGNGAGNGGPGEAKVAASAGQGASKGGLSQEQVRRVVMAHLGAVRACYEGEAQRNPSLKGGVTVQWSIDPSGSVTAASLGGSTLSNPRVEGCVVRQVKGWHFPSADSPTSVAAFPFKFGVGG